MTKYWYRVDVFDGEESRVWVGTSELDPTQLITRLRSGEYLILSDLSYRDNQNRIVSWSNWDARLASVVYLNPQYVTSFMPFVGDPRSAGSSEP